MGFSRLQLFKALAAIIGAVAIVSLALIHFIPAPPSKVVMATAFKGASFEYYGRQYREIFARYRVDLELRETAGAVENVKLLQDPKSDVQIAFTTGGVQAISICEKNKQRSSALKTRSATSVFHSPSPITCTTCVATST